MSNPDDEITERFALLVNWIRSLGGNADAEQLRNLLADKRTNAQIDSAWRRTAHDFGCRCLSCWAVDD